MSSVTSRHVNLLWSSGKKKKKKKKKKEILSAHLEY